MSKNPSSRETISKIFHLRRSDKGNFPVSDAAGTLPNWPEQPAGGARRRFGSSLEAKCLFFFGLALAFVLTVSFLFYFKLTKTRLDTQNPLMGQLIAEREFLLLHFNSILSQDELKESLPISSPSLDSASDFVPEEYGPSDFVNSMKYLSESLGQKKSEQVLESGLIRLAGANPTPESDLDDFEKKLVADLRRSDKDKPVDRTDPDGSYHYYLPLRVTTSCQSCHPADPQSVAPLAESLRGVIRVTIPEPPASLEATRFWAFLLAATILTAFLGLVAFYSVIRWIIIRPLRTLKNVSEAISSGDITKRSELHTGDEFESLSVAFNQMLRHLVAVQDQLRQTNSQLKLKVDELAKQSLQLFETNKVKSDFMATMSHELRTPLNSILGFSEVLGSIDSLDDRQKRYVENINHSGQALLQMINDILDTARLDAGRLEAAPTSFKIASVIRAQTDMARPLLDKKNLDLICDVEADLPPLFQDESRVGQILNNLLSNAIKFTPEGGKITVEARRIAHAIKTKKGAEDEKEFFLEMRVIDTGVGISPEDQQIIFEKFRQAGNHQEDGTMTREYSGSGLGLSIVKELCRLLEGEIYVESRIGFGSVFIVILPWEFQDPNVSESPLLSDIRDFSQTRGNRKIAQ